MIKVVVHSKLDYINTVQSVIHFFGAFVDGSQPQMGYNYSRHYELKKHCHEIRELSGYFNSWRSLL